MSTSAAVDLSLLKSDTVLRKRIRPTRNTGVKGLGGGNGYPSAPKLLGFWCKDIFGNVQAYLKDEFTGVYVPVEPAALRAANPRKYVNSFSDEDLRDTSEVRRVRDALTDLQRTATIIH